MIEIKLLLFTLQNNCIIICIERHDIIETTRVQFSKHKNIKHILTIIKSHAN